MLEEIEQYDARNKCTREAEQAWRKTKRPPIGDLGSGQNEAFVSYRSAIPLPHQLDGEGGQMLRGCVVCGYGATQ